MAAIGVGELFNRVKRAEFGALAHALIRLPECTKQPDAPTRPFQMTSQAKPRRILINHSDHILPLTREPIIFDRQADRPPTKDLSNSAPNKAGDRARAHQPIEVPDQRCSRKARIVRTHLYAMALLPSSPLSNAALNTGGGDGGGGACRPGCWLTNPRTHTTIASHPVRDVVRSVGARRAKALRRAPPRPAQRARGVPSSCSPNDRVAMDRDMGRDASSVPAEHAAEISPSPSTVDSLNRGRAFLEQG